MKGDFSRLTFDPAKQYTRVLMQQGRVQLDADWNEQAAILLHQLRTLGADLIGPFGGPANPDGTPGQGFRLEVPRNADGMLKKGDFTLRAGRYYIDGILCENPGDLAYSAIPGISLPGKLDADTPYLLYLDVWERHVTWIQDEDLREVALAGADTASRAKVVWRVGAVKTKAASCPAVRREWAGWVEQLQPAQRGSLKAQARPGTPDDTNPCLASPDARYRGENQLYRVEIHNGGTAGTATFKWSSDNGSIVYPMRPFAAGGGTTTVTLEHLGLDDKSDLMPGDWVEIADNQEDLRNGKDPLLLVDTVDPDKLQVTLKGQPTSDIGQDPATPLLLRRWDHRRSVSKAKPTAAGVFQVTEGQWIDLENGVQISFAPADGGGTQTYRSGDYWLIPARVATGDVLWPGPPNAPVALPPYGVRHHYAPLGLVTLPADGPAVLSDCRTTFGCRATRLDTGTADWQVVAEPVDGVTKAVNRPADLVAPLPTGWAPLPGAWWISASPKAAGALGTYTYTTSFNLCPCFHNAGLSLSLLVDNSATVSLNTHQIDPKPGPAASKGNPALFETANQEFFLAGANVLRIDVVNDKDQGPTGFVLSGIVDTDGGSCC